MGSLRKFVDLMVEMCTQWNLGYDQSNRQDIRPGGECDCSSLVIFAADRAGFKTSYATYTGNMSSAFTRNGWKRVLPDGNPQYGDILLNDANHVAVYIGGGKIAQASIDERGRIAGGQSGDQTDYETNVRSYYDYPWDCYLRYVGGYTTEVGSSIRDASEWNPNGYDEAYVREVQTLLNKHGYNLVVDGILGIKTYAAVKDYQGKHQLIIDGIPGPETMGTLKSADGTPPASRSSSRSYADIRALQEAVRAVVDNVAGPDTRKRVDAVRQASKWGGVKFPYGVEFAQQVVGTDPDGIWGEHSGTCHDATVAAIQRAVGATVDEIWGDQTDRLVNLALNGAEQP